VRETQREQVSLAKRFGIDAFCFHYYWFGGRRLLERPLLDFLADQDANIGFCLSWANENWTRKWDASENEVLMQQDYTPQDDIGFIRSVLPFFADPRYLRVEGKPVLLVYRPQQMPEPRVSTERWRTFCREHGVGDIHLVACLTHGNSDYEQFGYDAGVEFPPNNVLAPDLTGQEPFTKMTGYVVRFRDVAIESLERDYSVSRVYRTVFPSWDNTARFGHRSLVVLDGNPGTYERWLRSAASKTVSERAPGDRLLFINAWNEWAEGCHLEPDQRFGLAFLEATRRVKDGRSDIDAGFPETGLPETPPSSPPTPVVVVRKESYGLRIELAMWGCSQTSALPCRLPGSTAHLSSSAQTRLISAAQSLPNAVTGYACLPAFGTPRPRRLQAANAIMVLRLPSRSALRPSKTPSPQPSPAGRGRRAVPSYFAAATAFRITSSAAVLSAQPVTFTHFPGSRSLYRVKKCSIAWRVIAGRSSTL